MPDRLTVLGSYEPEYNRTRVLLEGCRSRGICLTEHRFPWGSPFNRKRRLRAYLRNTDIGTDPVLIPFPCHHEVPVVRKMTRSRIIFDPLISRYMTKIEDMGQAGRVSLHAWINSRVDRRALHAADVVIADTLQHKNYFCDRYGIDPGRVEVVRVGYHADDFFPLPHERTGAFRVGFYGSFLPLHGVDRITAAARILNSRDIRFEIVGGGSTLAPAMSAAKDLDTVIFHGSRPYGELNTLINSWDVCLGIFGTSIKVGMVIPNKIYHYAACAKPIVTIDTPAIRELFVPGKDICATSGNPEEIAEAIEKLAHDREMCRTLGEEARRRVAAGCTHVQIGDQMRGIVSRL